jgi:predicted lipoprotein with Yx(FWY)xxD motif
MTRMRRTLIAATLLALAAVAAFGAAGSFGGTTTTAHSAAAKKKPALALRTTSLGKVIVDSKGRTLYQFGADTKNRSNCADACAGNWPPAAAPSKPTVAKGLSQRKLKVIKRADGTKQLSYAGHPLYRFIADQKRGDVTGQGIDAFGGLWHVVAASGKAITKSPQSSSQQPAPAPDPSPYPGY